MIHLDTNFLIAALQPGSLPKWELNIWLRNDEIIQISLPVLAEFLCGPVTQQEEVSAYRLFPNASSMTADDARKGAALFNATGRRSRSLFDCLIAAIALREGAQLATLNRADFLPFVPYGLQLTQSAARS